MFKVRNILFLADLSENSNKSMSTVLRMALRLKSRVLLYHACPNVQGEEQIRELRAGFEHQLQALADYSKLEDDCLQMLMASEDFPGGALLTQLISDADLVVMGQGKNEEKVIRMVEECPQPLLIIPEHSRIEEIAHILYCSSYEKLAHNEPLDVLKYFANEYKSEIRLAHVKTHDGKPNSNHVEQSRAEGRYLEEDAPISYKLIRSRDVIKGIGHYIKKKGDNDLVVMIRRKHHIFEKFFGKNFTFRMLQQTEIPLLILKEPQLN